MNLFLSFYKVAGSKIFLDTKHGLYEFNITIESTYNEEKHIFLTSEIYRQNFSAGVFILKKR